MRTLAKCIHQGGTTRNRMAQYYMMKHYDDLPDCAKTMFEEARQKGDRKTQTKIINGIMKKQGNAWQVDLSSPMYTELAAKYEKKWAGQSDTGVIRAVAEQKVGGSARLQECIDAGEVMVTTNDEDKKQYFVFRSIETGKQTGVHNTKSVSSKNAISAEAAKKISDVLAHLNWRFSYTKKEEEVLACTNATLHWQCDMVSVKREMPMYCEHLCFAHTKPKGSRLVANKS